MNAKYFITVEFQRQTYLHEYIIEEYPAMLAKVVAEREAEVESGADGDPDAFKCVVTASFVDDWSSLGSWITYETQRTLDYDVESYPFVKAAEAETGLNIQMKDPDGFSTNAVMPF